MSGITCLGLLENQESARFRSTYPPNANETRHPVIRHPIGGGHPVSVPRRTPRARSARPACSRGALNLWILGPDVGRDVLPIEMRVTCPTPGPFEIGTIRRQAPYGARRATV